MEEEARQILRAALAEPVHEEGHFLARIRQRFAGLGDVNLAIEPREPVRSSLEVQEREAACRGAGAPAKPAARASSKPRTRAWATKP